MHKYMASYKGTTAGVFDTPRKAAEDFFTKYPGMRTCRVDSVQELPNGLVASSLPGGVRYPDITRATVASLPD